MIFQRQITLYNNYLTIDIFPVNNFDPKNYSKT